jgi:hypothetical protein
MTDTSARLALPYILPGQAQKEAWHNEALALIDMALHAAVEEGPLATPPDEPEEGQCWIVGTSATGDWAGKDDNLACRTSGGWRFLAPFSGLTAWNADLGCWLYWSASGWSDGSLPAAAISIDGQQVVGPRLPDVPSPSGGTIIDAEARDSIDGLIATLKSHGLID